jgi:hypothetical protein
MVIGESVAVIAAFILPVLLSRKHIFSVPRMSHELVLLAAYWRVRY